MSREIKFRVWDGEKMWFPSHIDFAMSAGKPEPWGVGAVAIVDDADFRGPSTRLNFAK